MKTLIALLLLTSLSAQAKLLDKVAGVINDKIFTLSEIERIQKTIKFRREVSPFIFKKAKYSKAEVLKILQNQFIIKDKLSEIGYVFSDDSVDSQIRETEKQLGLTRDQLLEFLKGNGVTFNEYFELIRSAMEFNRYNRVIIAPLVTITDQEIKNYYYKLNTKNKALEFNYTVVDFTLPSNLVSKKEMKTLTNTLSIYQKTGNIPSKFKEIDTTDLGTLSDDDLSKDLSQLFRATDESSFSKPYVKDGIVHIFFLKKKDLKESKDFLSKRGFIHNKIFLERSNQISTNWFKREALNYYILENL